VKVTNAEIPKNYDAANISFMHKGFRDYHMPRLITHDKKQLF